MLTVQTPFHPHSERELIDALMSIIASHAEDDQMLSEMLAQQDLRSKAELRKEREAMFDALSQMEGRRRRQWLAYEKGKISLEEFAESRLALREEEEGLEGQNLKAALANLIQTIAVYEDGRMEISYST